MLSYMVPVEEKPPPAPVTKGRLALELSMARAETARSRTTISKESSSSSFGSDLTCSSMTPTAYDKPKHKLLTNGTKHTTLKRVSFGSSKGSMVETLVYESPLQEEPENSPPPRLQQPLPPLATAPNEDDSERSKVKVSFYQGARRQCVSPPLSQPGESQLTAVLLGVDTEMADPTFNRQISTESGWDNPFRPDGDLSREADEIVSLIKGGKPITPTPGLGAPQLAPEEEKEKHQANNEASPKKASPAKLSSPKGANGTKTEAGGPVEVQRAPPPQPQHPEHVTIKKKPKCKCCVLQ